MSTFISTARAYVNFALGLRSFLRNTTTIEDIKENIRHNLAHREANFLSTLKTSVYDYPESPYQPLLEQAKLTYADIEKLVSQKGLEGTLETLYDAGVYVTFEEMKGRVPIKRGNLEYPVTTTAFDNPNLNTVMFTQSSGSTGKPTRTKLDLDFVHQNGSNHILGYNLADAFGVPTAVWYGMMPDITAFKVGLRFAHAGHRVERWFTPVRRSPSLYFTAMTYLAVGLIRLNGHPFPMPEYVPIANPHPIVEWIVASLKQYGKCLIKTTASKAVRLSVLAQKLGYDLTGTLMVLSSEPVTPAKSKEILASGANHINSYSATDFGAIGISCHNPIYRDGAHVLTSQIALIQRPVEVLDQTVDAICLTTLIPTAPKMLLNALTDDFGNVKVVDCGCPLHDLGLHHQIYDVRSYRKLTGEGVTLVGSDMEHILEHEFPTKFGGNLLDYQLVEEEDEQGFTRVMLYVAPHLPIDDEQELIDTLLKAMTQSVPSVQLAQPEFEQAQTIGVRRENPLLTSRGKYFSIYTLAMRGRAHPSQTSEKMFQD